MKYILEDQDLEIIRTLLTSKTNYAQADIPGSIMDYGTICTCDDSFMCEHRVNHLIDFITSREQVNDQAAAPPYPVFTTSFDYPLLVEDHLGERHKVPLNQFRSTGVAPDWAAAKSQAEKYGVSSLGTVGYFRTPDGVLACTSRFQYYLDQEKTQS